MRHLTAAGMYTWHAFLFLSVAFMFLSLPLSSRLHTPTHDLLPSSLHPLYLISVLLCDWRAVSAHPNSPLPHCLSPALCLLPSLHHFLCLLPCYTASRDPLPISCVCSAYHAACLPSVFGGGMHAFYYLPSPSPLLSHWHSCFCLEFFILCHA